SPPVYGVITAVSIHSLRALCLRDFQIDIGQVAFFKGLMEEAGLSDRQAEQLRVYVEEKNMLAIELMLRREKISEKVVQRLMQLPALYGGPETLDEAQRITRHPLCMAALRNIQEVLALLREEGLGEYVSVDLGMVHAIHYYSGIIFRGITGHLGKPLLSGGRYDGLPADFGRPMSATGFAVTLRQLLEALERQGMMVETPRADVLLGYAPGSRVQALAEAERLRAQGRTVEYCYLNTRQALADVRAEKNIARAVFVDAGICQEVE
ncbi:MAG: ATP phosphoribosyltransferase regulatory subunit, partial [Clostridia bacterium]